VCFEVVVVTRNKQLFILASAWYYFLKLLHAEVDNGDVDVLITKTTDSESLLAPINSQK